MFRIELQDSRSESDARAMVSSFFPGEELEVTSLDGMEALPHDSAGLSTALTVIRDGETIVNVHADRKDGPNPVAIRNMLKRRLYIALSHYTGRELPWGTLSGVRPTKLVRELLSEGRSEGDAKKLMEEFYLAGRQKTELALAIAKREMEILAAKEWSEGYSLYIGIPFCPSRCLYCSFTSYPRKAFEERVGEYLKALDRELSYVGEAFKGERLDSIYIGGGTPTALNASELSLLFDAIEKQLDLSSLLEYTVECGRADTVTEEKLEALKKHYVNRISINPQTMSDETLLRIGRRHSAADVRSAFHLARKMDFDDINMDIILGLPGETEEDLRHTLSEIKALGPESLTVHSLALKRSSRLKEEGGFSSLGSGMDMDAAMALATQEAGEMGLYPYYLYRQKNMSGNLENTGFAKRGREGIYNILMMEEKESIVAIGPGTVSKRVDRDGRIRRAGSVKDLGLYLQQADEMIERKIALFRGRFFSS